MDRNAQIINKIIGYANKILGYCEGVHPSDFTSSSQLIDTCVMNLIQIAELSRLLDDDFLQKHSGLPWRQIRGLRNRIVHDYEGINLEQIRTVVYEDLPLLIRQLILISS